MVTGNRDAAGEPWALVRLGCFVAYWAAGVLSLTDFGRACRSALKI